MPLTTAESERIRPKRADALETPANKEIWEVLLTLLRKPCL